MEALYKLYAKIRLDQITNMTTLHEDNDDILFYTIEKNEAEHDQPPIAKRVLDLGSALGLATFLAGQLDVVTALGVVANLEKKAQYDPRFRTSFPTFLRQNSWFL